MIRDSKSFKSQTGSGSNSVADPEVFGPPRSGSVSTKFESGSGSSSRSFFHQSKILGKKNFDSYCFVTSLGLYGTGT
jgi:hypothetical protein